MGRIILPILLFLGMIRLTGCMEPPSREKEHLDNLVKQVGSLFAPDARTSVYDISTEYAGGAWQIRGETDQPRAHEALLDSMERLGIRYVDSIMDLPHPDLDGKDRGVIRISVANMRSGPRHPAELVTQALLGMPVRVLKQKGGWYLIQTPDQYLGWVDRGAVTTMDDAGFTEYQRNPKVIYTSVRGIAYEQPDESSPPVSDLVAGNVLTYLGEEDGFIRVMYPDDRMAYVRADEARELSGWMAGLVHDPDTLVTIARDLMGSPYLWGGTSVKGMDCSGFTKSVYLMNGMILPRDASQQNEVGSLVDDQKQYDLLEPGDLLFFGRPATDTTSERVVHVGMWIGNMKFIHASGDVHISSMDPADPAYDAYNDDRYLRTRRILGADDMESLLLSRKY